MSLRKVHEQHGAQLASDGIPLHCGNIQREYHAALNNAILLDRSHEGRIRVAGQDRHTFLNRMSTNDIMNMAIDEARATVFTNPNGRILQRATVYNRDSQLLLITEPGQGSNMTAYLQRNIFFNDRVKLANIESQTRQFAIHGPKADEIIQKLAPEFSSYSGVININGNSVFLGQRKPICGSHWIFVADSDRAAGVYQAIFESGKAHGLLPSGGIVYNALRIRGGIPAGKELSSDFIPLEAGLWDEVSFHKGCYTGQEIIARMESRGKLAKALVKINLTQFIEAPAAIYHEGREIGALTSSAIAPDGELFALGVIKTPVTKRGTRLQVGKERIAAQVIGFAGTQPAYLTE